MFTLRPATESDAAAIRELIRAVHINPTGLDWRRFVVAVDEQGEVIASGQIKPHSRGEIQELASIAVRPAWRGQGAARAIIEHFLVKHPGPIYLTCRSSLRTFYEKFGFRVLEESEMPAYFRRIHRLVEAMEVLRLVGEELLVMKRGPD